MKLVPSQELALAGATEVWNYALAELPTYNVPTSLYFDSAQFSSKHVFFYFYSMHVHWTAGLLVRKNATNQREELQNFNAPVQKGGSRLSHKNYS